MSNVDLMIGGRNFTVSCAAGEESHVALMGRLIDGKVAAMGDMAQSESRMLLYAALLLADELHEARQSKPAASPPTAQPAPPAQDETSALLLTQIAERLENLADRLEA